MTTFLKGNSTCSIWDTHGKIENPSENISNSFFEDQPKEICSHLREKASKGRFLKPKKLQHHTNEGKGNLRRKKERREEKKAIVSLAMVHLVITLSKLRLDIVCGNRINYHFTGSYQGSGDGCEACSVFGDSVDICSRYLGMTFYGQPSTSPPRTRNKTPISKVGQTEPKSVLGPHLCTRN